MAKRSRSRTDGFRPWKPKNGEVEVDNPNSGVVWHYSMSDSNEDGEIDFEEEMHRTIGTVAIKDDVLYIADFSGLVHCLDAKGSKDGKPIVHFTYDMLAQSWGSPLIADGHVFIGDEDGDVAIFEFGAENASRSKRSTWAAAFTAHRWLPTKRSSSAPKTSCFRSGCRTKSQCDFVNRSDTLPRSRRSAAVLECTRRNAENPFGLRQLWSRFQHHPPDGEVELYAAVIQSHGAEDTLKILRSREIDLVIVNRKLDRDYTDGMEVIKAIKADPKLGPYRSCW